MIKMIRMVKMIKMIKKIKMINTIKLLLLHNINQKSYEPLKLNWPNLKNIQLLK